MEIEKIGVQCVSVFNPAPYWVFLVTRVRDLVEVSIIHNICYMMCAMIFRGRCKNKFTFVSTLYIIRH